MKDYKFIITQEITETFRIVWKLEVKQGKKIVDSKIYSSLEKIKKKIKSYYEN